MESRWEAEAAFANAEYGGMLGDISIKKEMLYRYSHPRDMWDWRQRAAALLGPVNGAALLDLGCGPGEEAVYFAKLGARVTGIDLSEIGIHVGRERAAANGLRIDFRVMNCLKTSFPDDSFDLVHGLGILHHIGLLEGLAEVKRVLKPGGNAVFLEPLRGPWIVESLKHRLQERVGDRFRLTRVTDEEENLLLSDVREACSDWAEHQVFVYRLTYRLRKLLIPRPLWNWSLRLDHVLLRAIRPLGRFAGAAVIRVRK